MELSLLCDVKVFLCVIDKMERVSIYSSEKITTSIVIGYILNQGIASENKEFITNSDFKAIFLDKSKPDSKFYGDTNFEIPIKDLDTIKFSGRNSNLVLNDEPNQKEIKCSQIKIDMEKVISENVLSKEPSIYSLTSVHEKGM